MGLRSTIRRWLEIDAKPATHEPRDVLGAIQSRRQNARYDGANYSDEYRNIWANADRYDADSANSKEVRHTLIARHRYEIGSNGFSDGIAQTWSTDLIGNGPTLRMQTGSQPFNQMIEMRFYLWWKAAQMRRKLWCMAHAKHSDGETFAVIRRNPRINHDIPLDVVLYEAEQCQTPFVPFDQQGYIDGIKFDEFGNPVWFDILRQHPGTANGLILEMEPERVPANLVLHWFKMRRPGQHRGIPECSSTLNVGAAARRWREATLGAAETAADLNVLLKTTLGPDADAVRAMSSYDIQKRMMTTLPMGWDATQMKSEFPTATYEAFHKSLINEQARPKSMPYNKAACDSSSYNYASGRLDHQTYYAALDVEREDCNDSVLDPLFNVWLDLAIVTYGWLGGNPEAVGPGARVHMWDWPKHRVADVESEANANAKKLQSGQVFLHQLYTDAGLDLDDEITKAATSLSVTEDEIRKRLIDVILPPAKELQSAPPKVNGINRLNGHAPVLNGASHEN